MFKNGEIELYGKIVQLKLEFDLPENLDYNISVLVIKGL